MKEVILTDDFSKRLMVEKNSGWLLSTDTYNREAGLTAQVLTGEWYCSAYR